MTVKELKAALEGLPDHMDVMIQQNGTEFNISLLETAEVKEVEFTGEKVSATDKCLVLSDE